MKFRLKDFSGDLLVTVEKTRSGVKVEMPLNDGVVEEDTIHHEDYFRALFSQPYISESGGRQNDDEFGVVSFSQVKELKPTDKDFFNTIIADGPSLGFIAEKVG